MQERLNEIARMTHELCIKASMPNDIIRIKNSLFYMPNYPLDVIQRLMVTAGGYWDTDAIDVMDKYITSDSVICDIGANIGSHTLYWAVERKVKKVHAFEPIPETYSILKRNVELNNLEQIVTTYNIGLSNKETNAEIDHFNLDNIGATSLKISENGNFKLVTLDSLNIEDKIDLIKIDVEGAEVEVLEGAINTIKKYKPVIVVESFDRKTECDFILCNIGYKLKDIIRAGEDFVYAIED